MSDSEVASTDGDSQYTLSVRGKNAAEKTQNSTRRKRAPEHDEDEDDNFVDGDDDDDGDAGPSRRPRQQQRRRTRAPSLPTVDEDGFEEFNPDQPMEDRRRIARDFRDLQRGMRDNPDEYMQADPGALMDFLDRADRRFGEVKQTTEAAVDSRGLLMATEMSNKRMQRLSAGNIGGIDVDEFVSKCIAFMRVGENEDDADDDLARLSATQRQRRQHRRTGGGSNRRGAIGSDDEDDENTGEGDILDWARLGRYASIPSILRPGLPGFLLGPLSVERKARKITKKTAPLRLKNLEEVRPQELRPEDLARSEKNDLTAICKKICARLEAKQMEAQEAVEAELEDYPDASLAQQTLAMHRHGLRSTGGIDLVKFVINPFSFGQTVENMFYVSFLVREGKVKLDFDDHGLPSLEPVSGVGGNVSRQDPNTTRHQAVMTIDMETWRDLISAFEISEPMIEHREERQQEGPGRRGWYT